MELEISPDMQFYNLLEGYPYNSTNALCEYIDNAIQAFIDHRENDKIFLSDSLRIEIEFIDNEKKSSITIRDYGVGIRSSDVQRALKPAYRPEAQSLSEFGIGMKAASLWFGRKWELTSYPINEEKSFKIIFDLDALLLENSTTVNAVLAKKDQSSGVKIQLSHLRRNISKNSVESIWRELQEIYQIFINRENAFLTLSCKYNGTELVKNSSLREFSPQVEILKYPTAVIYKNKPYSYGEEKLWIQRVNFVFEGKQITGFLLALKVASQTSNPGIRLFRYDRLIRGSSHQPYRPIDLVGTPNKHAPSRIYGELHLDGQAISSHKSNFQFDEAFFLETLRNQEGVKALIDEAENYRAREAALPGKVVYFSSEAEYLKFTEKNTFEKPKTDKTNEDDLEDDNKDNEKKKTRKRKARKKIFVPLDILREVQTTNTLLQDIVREAITLYENQQWWPFSLCYRVVLEIGIIEKIQGIDQQAYEAANTKGISALLKYLSGNLNLIDSKKYPSLHRSLKGDVLSTMPQIDLMNVASHGHYKPFQSDSETLLKNTQSLIEWIFE